jgi:intein/homing endonuclease
MYQTKYPAIGNRIKIKGNFEYKPVNNKYYNKAILPDYVNSDLAYLLGLWTAEGSNGIGERISISATEIDITNFLKSKPFNLNFVKSKNNSWRTSSKNFYHFMCWMGIKKGGNAISKQVPYKIMQANKETVAAFISGFFDGDGGSNKKGYVGCSSISYPLIEQLRLLLLHHFCIDAIISKHKPGVSKIAIGKYPLYQLKIRKNNDCKIFYEQIGFRLKRKQANQKNIKQVENRIQVPGVPGLIWQLYKLKASKTNIFRTNKNKIVDIKKLNLAIQFYKDFKDHPAYKKLLIYKKYIDQ